MHSGQWIVGSLRPTEFKRRLSLPREAFEEDKTTAEPYRKNIESKQGKGHCRHRHILNKGEGMGKERKKVHVLKWWEIN